MSDYISRKKALYELDYWESEYEWNQYYYENKDKAYSPSDVINRIESSDVRENVRARWTYGEGNGMVCSNCGNSVSFTKIDGGWTLGRFCQTCGADMREVKE